MSMMTNENHVRYVRDDGLPGMRITCGGGRTKQDMKDECDINKIMARFQKTGAISHFAKHAPSYGFAPAVDFHQATETVRRAQEMFDDLPSKLRKKFENDPAKFLAFVQDEKNAEEMLELGLRQKKPQERLPATAEEIAALLTPSDPPKPAA